MLIAREVATACRFGVEVLVDTKLYFATLSFEVDAA